MGWEINAMDIYKITGEDLSTLVAEMADTEDATVVRVGVTDDGVRVKVGEWGPWTTPLGALERRC